MGRRMGKFDVARTGVDRWGTGGGGRVPHFSAQKNCEAYSLIHHSSLLKAATQD